MQSVAEAQNATDVLTESLEQTGSVRAQLGAIINRYQSAIEGASMRGMDMREARSRIRMLNMLRRLQSLQSNKYWHKPHGNVVSSKCVERCCTRAPKILNDYSLLIQKNALWHFFCQNQTFFLKKSKSGSLGRIEDHIIAVVLS